MLNTGRVYGMYHILPIVSWPDEDSGAVIANRITRVVKQNRPETFLKDRVN
jgi:hypothetical protein